MKKKIFICLLSFSLFSQLANAKKGPAEKGDYIVPTPAHLVGHSRFEVAIDKSFVGPNTTEIGYTFPKELTGNPPLSVTLKPKSNSLTEWDSSEMSAACAINGDLFSCNMYLKPSFLGAESNPCDGPISLRTNAIDYIQSLNLSTPEIEAKIAVVDNFYCSEPAGFLSYEFDESEN